MKLPVDFPGTLTVVCLADKLTNPDISHSRDMYDQLFTRMGVEGSFLRVEGSLSSKAVEAVFKEVDDLHYKLKLFLETDFARCAVNSQIS